MGKSIRKGNFLVNCFACINVRVLKRKKEGLSFRRIIKKMSESMNICAQELENIGEIYADKLYLKCKK